MDSGKEYIQALPVRTYLDHTVVPIVLEGMKALVRERPPNPCEYLGLFLLKNASRADKPPPAAPTAATVSSNGGSAPGSWTAVPGSAPGAAPATGGAAV
ncbi:hypothetical protein BC828DRAFT_343800 [Blastocladiella britannica]|nr:hypothetical protein BC828DRAFT_343800 [Blastocladiella britannica]